MANAPTLTPSPEHARDAANKAMAWLAERDIAPFPVNYAVAYDYVMGTTPELKLALDEQLQAGPPLDDFLLRDLYEQHLAPDNFKQFHGMRDDLHKIMQNLLQTLGEADSNASEYVSKLETNLQQLRSSPEPNTLQAIAGDLLSAALDANSRNQHLQEHLESAHQETEQLRQELEQQRHNAMIDHLTGLLNRRSMEHYLQELLGAEPASHLSMLLLDIDHFKGINDKYGHATGDVVIRNVAEMMRKCIRGEDLAFRYGGEEFMVLLPNTPLSGAITVAETIRKRIESLRLVRRHDNFTLDPFTISLGVACRRADDTPDSLFQRADEALYFSKNNGRNRVSDENILA